MVLVKDLGVEKFDMTKRDYYHKCSKVASQRKLKAEIKLSEATLQTVLKYCKLTLKEK